MRPKLAVKRLTASDLTFFEWHFRNIGAGNQKAINLNADVFIGELYPELPELSHELAGKIPIDLSVYGPGGKGLHNLQRKIVKFGTYKNWRLNGEFVYNPDEDKERYNQLSSGDFALMEFSGAGLPTSLKLILLAKGAASDQSLHEKLDVFLGLRKMASLSVADLESLITKSNLADDHPVGHLLLDSVLEDVAFGGSHWRRRLHAYTSGRQLSKDDLLKVRKRADEIGRLGEEWVFSYLNTRVSRNELRAVEWTAQENALAPYDFKVVTATGESILIDVKSTAGEFERPLHFSFNEILQIANGADRYEVYRIFAASPTGASLRVCRQTRNIGLKLLEALSFLPDGVTADSVSLNVDLLAFEDEVSIDESYQGDGQVEAN